MSPALILIHGATLNRQMWGPLRRHLPDGLRIEAPDLPGHGARRGERFTLEGAAEAVQQAVAAVAPAPVILVGDSLGGYTALAAAASVPQERLLGLVVGGCTGNFEGFRTMLHFRGKVLLFKLLIALMGEERVVRASEPKVRKLLADHGAEPADIEAILAAGMSVKVFAEAVAALTGVDHLARLAAIDKPVFLLNGTRDTVMLRQEARFLAAGPRVQGRHFDCEHGVSLLQPAGFADVVMGLVRQSQAAQAAA